LRLLYLMYVTRTVKKPSTQSQMRYTELRYILWNVSLNLLMLITALLKYYF
jgi:hypothetical protein